MGTRYLERLIPSIRSRRNLYGHYRRGIHHRTYSPRAVLLRCLAVLSATPTGTGAAWRGWAWRHRCAAGSQPPGHPLIMTMTPQPTGDSNQLGAFQRLWSGDDSLFARNRTLVIAFALILVLLIVSGIRQPGFLSVNNLRQQFVLATFLGTVAAGQTLVILTGGIDLSVAWNLNFAAILFTQTIGGSQDAGRIALGTVLALLAGTAVGVVNGLGIAFLRIPSLVMTLGMNTVMLGLTLVYTNGSPQ